MKTNTKISFSRTLLAQQINFICGEDGNDGKKSQFFQV